MSKKSRYQLDYVGDKVQQLLDIINNKTLYGNATTTESGLMSASDKQQMEEMEDSLQEMEESTGVKVMMQAEYDELPVKRMDTLYATRNKYRIIHRIYLGTILIAKRSDESGSMCFPYTFPIVF